MNILITGGAGYVGSVLTNLALQKGHTVKALDLLWFNKTTPIIHYNNPRYTFIKGDLRDNKLVNSLLDDVDFVIHTAAIVGDPASKLFPELTQSINGEGTKQLINSCAEKKIKGFVFFSTCSNYGVSDGIATEESNLNPLSLYAETKVNAEKYLINEVKGLDYLIGRLSTVYGTSPRMRFDLTVNDFTLNGFIKKYLDIFLPESYRPYIHVYDLANIILTLIENFNAVKNNVFNIGFPGENYQKITIANAVKKFIPDVKIDILKEGGDRRDYQVAFTKLHKFIKIDQVFNVEKAVKEIFEILKSGIIANPTNDIYYNTTPAL